MEDIQTFLKLHYSANNVPCAIYHENNCLFYLPEGAPFPPAHFINELIQEDKDYSFFIAPSNSYYLSIPINNKEKHYIIFGPICFKNYTKQQLSSLAFDYVISREHLNDFYNFIVSIPTHLPAAFFKQLELVNYYVNHNTLSAPIQIAPIDTTENYYQSVSLNTTNRTYIVEKEIIDIVRNGDLERLKNFNYNEDQVQIGINASSYINQLKHNIIITSTLCSRAAIAGGVDYDSAYQLSDSIIMKSELYTSYEELTQLMNSIVYLFTKKVCDNRTPVTQNQDVIKAIRYIQNNINQPIKVDDVCHETGFSKTYFSHLFKKETHMTIHEFILEVKLEASCSLLSQTNKSIVEISSFLCFSSQPHFQNCFKAKYKQTPLQYRKTHQK